MSTPEPDLRTLPHSPWGPIELRALDGETVERILDSATLRFAEIGIAATTMEAVAQGAGISRVWLYRHFPGRDELVRAVLARETARFLDGIAGHVQVPGTPVEVVTEMVVYALGFLRHHELLQRLLVTEPNVALPFLTNDAGPLLRMAVDAGAPLLQIAAGLDEARAGVMVEVLVRLVASVVLTPHVRAELTEEAGVRAFVRPVVEALLGAGGRG